MAFDSHKNFAFSTIATAPSPASTGLSLTVQSSDGAKFPAVSFNCVVCPASTNPSTSNAEIVRVSNIVGDTFTIVRQQEGTSARSILVGDYIAAVWTALGATDIESIAPNASTITTTGTQTALAIPSGRGDLVIFANNATSLTIQGIAAGLIGQRLAIFAINSTVTLEHQSGSATAANRIICPGSANFSINATSPLATFLVYDTTAARWRVETDPSPSSILQVQVFS